MPSFHTCPATCELCGNWLPQHNATCPRNGVHPSQWNLDIDNEIQNLHEAQEDSSEYTHDFYIQLTTDKPSIAYTLQ